MKKILLPLVAVLSVSCLVAQSRSATNLDVYFTVPDVHYIAFTDNAPMNFTLRHDGNSGRLYEPETRSKSYNITTTGTNKRLLAKLDQNMPTNTFLEVRADPPRNATSVGYVSLNAMQQPLVTGITNVQQNGLLMDVRLRAELGAPVVNNHNRLITFTISD